MDLENVYFFNGSAYAGKSTMVKRLAEKYDGIACEENYHEALMDDLDWNEFPNLGYTANLKDWAEFIRRTPDEYAKWIEDVAKECEILETWIQSSIDYNNYFRTHNYLGDTEFDTLDCTNATLKEVAMKVLEWLKK